LTREEQDVKNRNSFYQAFDALMINKGFRSTARSHWSRPTGAGAEAVLLDLRPLAHDYEVQLGVTYSHRPHPDSLRVYDCVARGWPDGLTSEQRMTWSRILENPVASASDPTAISALSALVDAGLRTLCRWRDPRRLYRDLHRGRAQQMIVDWRRLIEACKRYDRADEVTG
jgi:hypothetical protein